jgi:hypothetical protein
VRQSAISNQTRLITYTMLHLEKFIVITCTPHR